MDLKTNTPVVYFISDGQGHLKIGIASDIKSRFTTLQVGSAYPLEIKHVIYTDSLDEAYQIENEYHGALTEHRVRGEWFEEDAALKYLETQSVDGKGFQSLADLYPEQFNICHLIDFFIAGISCTPNDATPLEKWWSETAPDYLKEHILKEENRRIEK